MIRLAFTGASGTGKSTLAEAVAAKGLNLDEVVKGLSALERTGEPAVPTEDEVAEPRNRRAEIIIR